MLWEPSLLTLWGLLVLTQDLYSQPHLTKLPCPSLHQTHASPKIWSWMHTLITCLWCLGNRFPAEAKPSPLTLVDTFSIIGLLHIKLCIIYIHPHTCVNLASLCDDPFVLSAWFCRKSPRTECVWDQRARSWKPSLPSIEPKNCEFPWWSSPLQQQGMLHLFYSSPPFLKTLFFFSYALIFNFFDIIFSSIIYFYNLFFL